MIILGERGCFHLNENKMAIKKQTVIEVAEELFLTQGLVATEMKEIAERALISRSTLYRMFDSRESLAFYVADKCLHELFDIKPLDTYGVNKTGFEILCAYTNDLVGIMVEKRRYLKFLSEFDHLFMGDYPDTPEARKFIEFNQQRHDRKMLMDILSIGVKDGSIRSDIDINMLELAIGNTLLGVAQRIVVREENYLQEYGYGQEILYAVIELILNGVCASYTSAP